MATHEHPQYPASNVPAHQSQMDELLTRIEAMSLKQIELNERNEGLQQRTKELEAIIAAGADRSQRAIPDHRGAPPSLTSQRGKKRGLRTRSGGQALPRLREDGSESEAEPEAHDDSAPPSALLPSESQGMRSAVKKSVYLGSKDLIDKSFKRSRAILQVRLQIPH